jgi:predicted P-loop ATPase
MGLSGVNDRGLEHREYRRWISLSAISRTVRPLKKHDTVSDLLGEQRR